jgi:hypothetical protein
MLLIDVVIAAVCMHAKHHRLSPLSWVLGLTVALLCADIMTGARLQTSSLLGYSLHTAARFTGIGNTAFAALAATTILVAALHVHLAPRRREALVFVACLFAFVVIIDGAPQLGDDVGGILTLVPIFALLLYSLTGRKLRWRTVATAIGATVGVLAVATTIDLLRPANARTHLGRFVASIGNSGSSEFRTTVARKLAGNLRTYSSVWCWVIVVIAFYLLYVLIWQRQGLRMLPAGSALRAGVAATLAASILGNLLNDSGVVVTALVFVYLGPFITLLALDYDEPAPTLVDIPPGPIAAPSRAPVPTAS